MIFAAILAGGKGTRVGAKVPKQFLELSGKPILISAIDAFLKCKLVDIIYVSVNEMWVEHTGELLKKYYDVHTLSKMKIVCGGNERIMSFINVINDIEANYGVNSEDIVLSHDAVRPFVTQEIIVDCIENTKIHKVAMASVRSADTTYVSMDGEYLTSTYDRKTLFLGQTPQGCKMDLLHDVINSYSEEELLSMTGTSQLFINKNINVKISLGSIDNFKITTLKDIDFAKFLLAESRDK